MTYGSTNITDRAINISLVILATIAVFYVLVVGKAFLVPLAVAIMVWYVINALSRAYSRIIPGVKRQNWVSTLFALISIVGFFSLTIDMVQSNIPAIKSAAPLYKARLDSLAVDVQHLAGKVAFFDFPDLNQTLGSIKLVPFISSLTGTFTSIINNVFLVLIYVLFLMLEQGTFSQKIAAIFPDRSRREAITSIISHAQEDIQTYLWIKTITSTLTGVVSYGVLSLVGVDFAGFWAFTIFLLNYIPTIGSIVATLFPALLALIQFDTVLQSIIVLGGVGLIQIMVGNFVEPKLMGNSLNLSPFVVMLSLTLWGSIWGVAGMILSVPITVILLIVFAHFRRTRYLAIMLSGDGTLKFIDESQDQLELVDETANHRNESNQ